MKWLASCSLLLGFSFSAFAPVQTWHLVNGGNSDMFGIQLYHNTTGTPYGSIWDTPPNRTNLMGQTLTDTSVNVTDTVTRYYWVYYYTNYPDFQNSRDLQRDGAFSFPAGSNVDITITVYPMGTNCTYHGAWSVRNDSASIVTFQLFENGSQAEVAYGQSTLTLGPGEYGSASFNTGGQTTNGYTVRAMVDATTWTTVGDAIFFSRGTDATGAIIEAQGVATSVAIGFAYCSPPSPTLSVYNYDAPGNHTPQTGTNAPINFGNEAGQGGTNALTEATAQAGFSGLYDAIKELTSTTDRGLRSLAEALGRLSGSTNATDVTGIEDRLDGLLSAATNATSYSGAVGYVTNLLGSAPGSATEATGDFNEGLLQAASDWTTPGDTAPSGIGDALTVEMVGYTWDFNPLNNAGMSGVFSVARQLFGWILVAGYILVVFKDVKWVINNTAVAGQLRAPRFNATIFGVGGDWGSLIYPVLLGIWLAALAALLAVVGTNVSGAISGEAASMIQGNPLSSVSGYVLIGVELARNFFPFTLFFGLFGALLTFKASLQGAVVLFNITTKLLVS